MANEPFIIERTFDAPIATVWKAITDKDTMKLWYFDLPAFRPEVGCEFTFSGGKPDGTVYVHLCQVKEVIAGRKISYSWGYQGVEGDSLVTFELFAEGDKTKLKLTHAGLETFPASNPHLAAQNFARGWTEIITVFLENFLSPKQ